MKPYSRRFLIASLALMLTFSLSGAVAGQQDWDFDLASDAPTGELSILLTNDDGYQAPGIEALRSALEAAGYDVTMVAPKTQRSGSSAALESYVSYEMIDTNGYWVDGPPATCVFVGASYVLPEFPDLIVSGTNAGANLGRFVPFSGTVGAASAGALIDVPSVALSTDIPLDGEPTDHYANVAQFATRLIRALERSAHVTGEILPPGTFLNVNYPPLPPDQVKGVRYAVQNMGPVWAIPVYVEDPGNPGMLNAWGVFPQIPPPAWSTDRRNYDAGYITVTLMNGDYTVSLESLRPRTRRYLRRVKP